MRSNNSKETFNDLYDLRQQFKMGEEGGDMFFTKRK